MRNPNVIAAVSLLLIIAAIALGWQKHYFWAWVLVAGDVAMLVGAKRAGRRK